VIGNHEEEGEDAKKLTQLTSKVGTDAVKRMFFTGGIFSNNIEGEK